MAQVQPMAGKTNQVAAFHKLPDLDTHVRVIEIEGQRRVELRDYIVSLGEYGRGYWFPEDDLDRVIDALLAIKSGRV